MDSLAQYVGIDADLQDWRDLENGEETFLNIAEYVNCEDKRSKKP